MNIDWFSSKSEVLQNPRLPAVEKQHVQNMIQQLPMLTGHIWMATSGSQGPATWTALSKGAILASAKVVNDHLQCTSSDSWINVLPDFHTGGLSIWARSHLCNITVSDGLKSGRWIAQHFHQKALELRPTLTSLVPAQVYDLASLGLKAPSSLRAVLVGGGALSASLYFKACSLGWKLLPTYGLTECASQVATADLDSIGKDMFPKLTILPHFQIALNEHGLIRIKGTSLLTGYAFLTPQGLRFIDPKMDGWLQTQDRGCINDNILEVQGRADEVVKIGGECVDMLRLDHLLEEIRLECSIHADVAIVALPNERLGDVIHLASIVPETEIQPIVELFQERVLPFEKIRAVHLVPYIPRTALQKLCRAELKTLILKHKEMI